MAGHRGEQWPGELPVAEAVLSAAAGILLGAQEAAVAAMEKLAGRSEAMDTTMGVIMVGVVKAGD